jgi:hypothetical protein
MYGLSAHANRSYHIVLIAAQLQVLNVLCLLETVSLLLSQAPEKELGKDANVVANQTILAQVILMF